VRASPLAAERERFELRNVRDAILSEYRVLSDRRMDATEIAFDVHVRVMSTTDVLRDESAAQIDEWAMLQTSGPGLHVARIRQMNASIAKLVEPYLHVGGFRRHVVRGRRFTWHGLRMRLHPHFQFVAVRRVGFLEGLPRTHHWLEEMLRNGIERR